MEGTGKIKQGKKKKKSLTKKVSELRSVERETEKLKQITLEPLDYIWPQKSNPGPGRESTVAEHLPS